MSTFTADFDLVIVGGGLVGNCLALALQGSGLKIALVEANTPQQLENSPLGDRALALSAGTAAELERLGVWQGVVAKATAITNIHVSDRGHFGKSRLSARKENVEALGFVIIARDIESHIAKMVENIEITQVRPARITGLNVGGEKVFATVNFNDDALNLSAKLLVGADGGNSSVRNLLGIAQKISDYQQTALITQVRTELPHHNFAYERFTESGPLALLPIKNNYCSVVWTRSHQDAEILMKSAEKEFIQQLQGCFGYRLGELALCAPRHAFPVSLIRARQMHVGRAVIIGNAAHQLHPVAGQGFNLGLRDIAQLAGMLLDQASMGGDIGSSEFLSNYVRGRQQDHDRTIRFTDSLVRIFSNEFLVLAGARNLGLAAFDRIPLAKSILSRHAMGLAQKLP